MPRKIIAATATAVLLCCTTRVMRKWTLTGNGELTITNFIDTPTVSYESKRIFLKKG